MKYIIKAGDTLGELALLFQLSISEIMHANPSIKDKNIIYKGQTIEIPHMCSHIRLFSSGGIRPTTNRKYSLSSMLNPDYYNKQNTYFFGDTTSACDDSKFTTIQMLSELINKEFSVTLRDKWGSHTPKYSKMEIDLNYSTIVIHHSSDGGSNDPSEIEKKAYG